MTDGDDAERALGRAVALGLPAVGIVCAVAAGMLASLGSALLVLAATALLGTIALLWTSVRTLSGDAPLPVQMETATVHRADAMSDRKRQALRALKDLENERALGRIDDEDYRQLSATYRQQAKDVLREMESEVAPVRDEAERIARDYLKRHGVAVPALAVQAAAPALAVQAVAASRPARDERVSCAKCSASNEPDAAFCKGCGAPMKAERAEGTDAKA
jgi:hypothetical protein